MKKHKSCSYTLIIPTFNRPDYLKRLISYYNKNYVKQKSSNYFKIIVADSSSRENKKKNKDAIKKFPDLDILHLNNFPTDIHPNYKASSALDYVKTKYCVFCADDDFVIIKGIKKSISFLDKNTDYTCAHGKYIKFRIENSKNKKQFSWAPTYSCNSIISSDAKTRVISQISKTCPTFYAVQKTATLKLIFKENKKYTDDSRFGELLITALTLIYGKMKCLDIFYAARDATSVPRNTNEDYYHTMADFKKQGIYDKKYSLYLECLSKHLSKNSQLSLEDSKKIIDKTTTDLFSRISWYHSPLEVYFHRIRILIERLKLPKSLDKVIRTSYRKVFTKKKSEFNKEIPSSKEFESIKKIKKHLLSDI